MSKAIAKALAIASRPHLRPGEVDLTAALREIDTRDHLRKHDPMLPSGPLGRALRVARQGFADGGDVPLLDTGPLPDQVWPDTYDPSGASRFGEVVIDAGRGLGRTALDIAKEYIPPSPQEHRREFLAKVQSLPADREEALAQTLRDFVARIPESLKGVAPGSGQAISQALRIAGVAGAGGAGAVLGTLPSEAGPGPSDQVKALQEELRNAGYYRGPLDGVMGPETRSANEAYQANLRQLEQQALERQRIEAERLKAEAEAGKATAAQRETERLAREAEEASRRRATGEERLREIEEQVPWYQRGLRDYGAVAGAVIGIPAGLITRGLAVRSANKAAEKAAERANALLQEQRGDWAARAGRINQFWSEGQKGAFRKPQAPFMANPNAAPAFKINPAAPEASTLYQPNRAANWATDAGIATGFGVESGIMSYLASQENNEVEAARQAYKDDPSEANIRRLQSALDRKAMFELGANFGRAGGATHLLSGFKMRRENVRPDVGAAEAERIRISDHLARSSGNPGTGQPQTPGPLETLRSRASRQTPKSTHAAKGDQTRPQGLAQRSEEQPASPTSRPVRTIDSRGRTQYRARGRFASPPDDDASGFARGGAVATALRIARRFARGGAVHTGPIMHVADGGRTDTVPLDVEAGTYIVPSAVVSALGESDTNAGYQRLLDAFPEARRPGKGNGDETVPIIAAGGEFSIPPSAVKRIGNGDMQRGHAALDAWVEQWLGHAAKEIANLPGPQGAEDNLARGGRAIRSALRIARRFAGG